MNIRARILKDMRSDRVRENYEAKNRLINPALYKELKARKKCMYCHKSFSGRLPEIHHKIPLSRGGSSDRENLMALCKRCHEKLDAAEGVGYARKT